MARRMEYAHWSGLSHVTALWKGMCLGLSQASWIESWGGVVPKGSRVLLIRRKGAGAGRQNKSC